MFSGSHREPECRGEVAAASLATADRAVCLCVWLALTNPQGQNFEILKEIFSFNWSPAPPHPGPYRPNTHTTNCWPSFQLSHRGEKKETVQTFCFSRQRNQRD